MRDGESQLEVVWDLVEVEDVDEDEAGRSAFSCEDFSCRRCSRSFSLRSFSKALAASLALEKAGG